MDKKYNKTSGFIKFALVAFCIIIAILTVRVVIGEKFAAGLIFSIVFIYAGFLIYIVSKFYYEFFTLKSIGVNIVIRVIFFVADLLKIPIVELILVLIGCAIHFLLFSMYVLRPYIESNGNKYDDVQDINVNKIKI